MLLTFKYKIIKFYKKIIKINKIFLSFYINIANNMI